MMSWKRAPVLCAVIAGGIAAGLWARTLGATRSDSDPAAHARHRGQGDVLIEYFDPACEGSRSLHKLLDQEFARARFQHVLVPVAIGRGAAPVPADALCALPEERLWQQATTWSQTPPRNAKLPGLDPEAVRACADTVEAATQHIASVTGTGKVVTPVVEFRGHVYVGTESTADLMRVLQRDSTP